MVLRNLHLNTENNAGFCFSRTQEDEERKGREIKGMVVEIYLFI